MLSLLAIILFGILIALFATQNTAGTAITVANYRLTDIPVYLLVLAGLLVGVVVSWILSLFNSISSGIALHGRDSKINDLRKTLRDQERKIHDLEADNTRLKGERDVERPRFGFFDRPKEARG